MKKNKLTGGTHPSVTDLIRWNPPISKIKRPKVKKKKERIAKRERERSPPTALLAVRRPSPIEREIVVSPDRRRVTLALRRYLRVRVHIHRSTSLAVASLFSPSARLPVAAAVTEATPLRFDLAFVCSLSSFCMLIGLRFEVLMENMNYEDFLLKPKDKWIRKSTTNVYCNLNGLPDIVKVLRKVGELAAFWRTCFGHLIDIPKDLTFSAGVLHNLLLRVVHVPGVTGQNEFHFSIGGKLLKFTQREFCLHVILEELHPMGNEREQPYLVGVDTDLLDDPQFVPNNSEEDDGRQRLDAEVGNDDNDGGQSRPQQKEEEVTS
ncbi:hypothetical protein LWI29_006441 [Acer saccharum]|uniref:Uncharacterized protein n=1 Tax=Acer saccharum TaxID=4024 RepID=A0AA39VWN4_ACESA|nr:hypothetical protein LWI29_006441 [Acer saccharum]